jgi:phosphoglycolate phosphatase-like HAD superfamily hydrolase
MTEDDLFPGLKPRSQMTHVLFDFDGTLSWLRHGWPRIMAEVMRQYYPARAGESETAIFDHLIADLLSLNGKPTIFQMMHFESEVKARGGRCPDPESMRQEYQDRLDRVIAERSAAIRNGKAGPDEFVVFGARRLLELLRDRGVTLYILSGTIQHRVREEAELLGLAPFFGPRIFGGMGDDAKFSKREVIDKILADAGIPGERLLSFGDGPVEVAESRKVGGLSIAVASNEDANGSGIMDPWKREQLSAAGAHGMIADYRNATALMRAIFGA